LSPLFTNVGKCKGLMIIFLYDLSLQSFSTIFLCDLSLRFLLRSFPMIFLYASFMLSLLNPSLVMLKTLLGYKMVIMKVTFSRLVGRESFWSSYKIIIIKSLDRNLCFLVPS
jgi:hypothetical protein